jgi:serine/threonine protein kinase
MYRSIRAGDFVFYDEYWGHISVEAKKLVLGMLIVDPKSRFSARDVLNDEWMQTNDDVLMSQSLDKSLVHIISFNARRKLKGAMSAVMFATKGAFWDMDTTAIWRENMHTSSGTGMEVMTSNSTSLFDQLYHLDSKMREGVHATMWQGTSTVTDMTYAIKVIKRENLNPLEDAAVLNEVSILKSLRHGHIIPLLDFIETPERFYLVMEKCNGGDVLDKVASIAQYSEKDACQLSKGLLDAVQYMHDHGIAHRDLKVGLTGMVASFTFLVIIVRCSQSRDLDYLPISATKPAACGKLI